MKVAWSWLKKLSNTELDVKDAVRLITLRGLEVSECKYLGAGLEDILVAQIEEKNPHPNADKLTYCKVNTGKEVLDIVCGAPNISKGDKVPLALAGTTLPNGMKLKKANIRGCESNGMMCSAKEMGLSDDHSGILILPESAKVGEKFVKEYGLDDYVIDIEVTSNRSDCLSAIGIARELASIGGKKVNYPDCSIPEDSKTNTQFDVKIEIKDPDLCPRYIGWAIQNVKIGAAPVWVQRLLEALGIRSINNVVDATNLVLLEWGHPLHSFDLSKIKDKHIIVRRAKNGEKLQTLDGIDRELTSDDLLIADIEKGIALAGIMGGANSEVGETTSDILLESAYFLPSGIRKTSKRLGLSTEASYRFERGVDWQGMNSAIARAAKYIADWSTGRAEPNCIDIIAEDKFSSLLKNPKKIIFPISEVKRVLGIELDNKTIENFLSPIEFNFKETNQCDPALEIEVPSFRNDISIPADIVEEIARIYGYDNIPTSVDSPLLGEPIKPTKFLFEEKIRDLIAGFGLQEVVNYSFISQELLNKLGLPENHRYRNAVKIKNPLSANEGVMRTSLLPSLLANLEYNWNRSAQTMKFFEIAPVYSQNSDKTEITEVKTLSAVLSGENKSNWDRPGFDFDFFDAKGIVEAICEKIGVSDLTYQPIEEVFLHPARSVAVLLENKRIGIIAEVHPKIVAAFSGKCKAAYLELTLDLLLEKYATFALKYEKFSSYPSVIRDIAVVVDKKTSAASLLDCVKKECKEYLEDVSIFDIFTGEQVQSGQKSVAIRMVLRSRKETLTDDSANALRERVMKKMATEFEAKLRE